jgi:hypothetical protein
VARSTFVARAGREYSARQAEGQTSDRQMVAERFDSIDQTMEKIQATLLDLRDR